MPIVDPGAAETDKIIIEIEKRIKKEYAQAEREIKEKLDDYLRRFKVKDKTWKKWVAEGKKTEADYKAWRTGQLAVGQRWEEMRNTISEDLLNTSKIAKSIATGYMPEVYALNHDYGTFQVEQASLTDTSYTLYSREAAERIFRDNPKMLPNPGKKVSQAIADKKALKWNNKHIQSVMMQAILQGNSIPDIATRLANVVGDSDRKAAVRNARTMATAAQNAGRIDSYKRANKLGIPTRKQWLATLDMRTRHEHRVLDGQIQDEDKPFEVDGMKIMFPGDPEAPGILVWNCRCTLIAAIKGHEHDLSDISDRRNEKLGDMTYAEWKAEKKSTSNPILLPEEKADNIRAAYIREYRGYGGQVASGRNKYLNIDQDEVARPEGEQEELKVFSRYVGTKTQDEILKQTNPHYQDGREYRINCQRTVVAEEMIYRGYDVTAKPYNGKDDIKNSGVACWQFDNITWYKDSQLKVIGNRSEFIPTVEKAFDNWGDGARAIVRTQWKKEYGGNGHFFFARREGNSIIYTDPQPGRQIDIDDYLSRSTIARNKLWIMRVDNRKVNDKIGQAIENVVR